MKDPYTVLGIKATDGYDVARKAYRNLSLKYHPDRNPLGEERFKEINDAWHQIRERLESESVARPMWVFTSLFNIRKESV